MITIFYILGTVIQYTFPMSYRMIGFIFCVGIISWMLIYKRKLMGMVLLIILLLGILNFKVNNEYKSELVNFFDKDIYVIGDITNIYFKEKMQFDLKVKEVLVGSKRYVVSDKVIVKFREGDQKLKAFVGERIGIHGVLLEPQKRRNPKMFDYQGYLKAKKVYGILYAKTEKIDKIGQGHVSFVLRYAYIVKKNMISIILDILPKKEGNILLGILLGDKDLLDEDIYNTFKNIGVAHVLAVSGLHVGILYMALDKMLNKFSSGIKLVSICVSLCFYVVITGVSPSVLRATSMIIMFICAPHLNRRYDVLASISTVAFIFLIINPMNLMNIGFQLSFIAVLSIVVFYKWIYRKLDILPENLAGPIAVSLGAQIGIIPMIMYHFNYVSLCAFIINVPIVMLVSAIVPLGFLMIVFCMIGIKFICIPLSWIVFYLLKFMLYLSIFMDKMPFSGIEVTSPKVLFIVFYYMFFYILTMEEDQIKVYNLSRKKGIVRIIALYILINICIYIMPKELELTFIDVGQGDCIFIKTPKGKNILIDGGGRVNEKDHGLDVGEDIVVPFLLKNGANKIDLMILSHAHRDHIGGLLSVLEHLKVDTLLMGIDDDQSDDLSLMKKRCMRQNTEIYKGEKGDQIEIEEDLDIEILHPEKDLIMDSGDDVNNNSLVVLMTYKGKNILFTGDIEREAEEAIIREYKNLSVDVLKVAHHGSDSSSTDEFIKRIKPKLAVIQVGKNRFGHPRKSVLSRFEKKGIVVYRNDRNGAVQLKFCGDEIKVECMLGEK